MGRNYDHQLKWAEREKRRRETGPAHLAKSERKKAKKSKGNIMPSNYSASYEISIDQFNSMFGSFSSPQAANPPKPKPELITVRWDDVVGQVEAKAAVREAIEGATKHAALYKRYGRKPAKGVLLYGPPGNGKTMLGKAAAGALAEMHGGELHETGFVYVKASDILDAYLGQSEKKISKLFARAREHKERHGYPAVLFIDEAEALLASRSGLHGWMGGICVPTFLAEMDGMKETGAFVILATNRPTDLDPAVLREGRIDRKILVGRPTRDDATALFAACLQERPCAVNAAELAVQAAAELYEPKHALYVVHLHDGGTKSVTLGAMTSGAQIAGLVEAAATHAIEREIATGDTGDQIGIRPDDFTRAIAQKLKEARELSHPAELFSFCEDFAESVARVDRVRAGGVLRRASLIAPAPAPVQMVLEANRERMPRC